MIADARLTVAGLMVAAALVCGGILIGTQVEKLRRVHGVRKKRKD